MKILIILLIVSYTSLSFANDSFITGNGKTYGQARNSASKIVYSQGLRIVGQNHHKDNDGNWVVVLKVRKR
jgi:hypothetical protein